MEVEGDATSAHIRQTAMFDPAGVGGRLYWYALYPLHRMIFAGMLRGLVRACENEPVRSATGARTRCCMSANTVSYRTHLAVSAAEASAGTPALGRWSV